MNKLPIYAADSEAQACAIVRCLCRSGAGFVFHRDGKVIQIEGKGKRVPLALHERYDTLIKGILLGLQDRELIK